MLSVLHGPFVSLEKAFVERLKAIKKGKPLAPVCIVAPSLRLANRLKELAVEAFPGGIAALHVHHLMSFARRLSAGAPIVDNALVLERLVARIIERDFPKGRYLSAVSETPQLARAILGVLNELREGTVDADEAYRAWKEGVIGTADDLKLAEILALHKAYGAELEERGWIDRAQLVRLAAERAPDSAWLKSFDEIIYYGFYELVQVQIDLFAAVAANHPTRLFYPYEKNHKGYAFSRDFYEQVVVGLAREKRELPAWKKTAKLFQGGLLDATVVHASGARDEVWACAKRILQWRDKGIPFGSIGVVARTLDPYSVHIEAVFRENAIPFSSSARLAADRDPAIAAVKSILALARDEFPRDTMMDLLSSPHFRAGESPDPVMWDAITRFLGIGLGVDEWRRRLPPEGGDVSRRGNRDEREILPDSAGQVGPFRAAVLKVLEHAVPPAGTSWSAFSTWLRSVLRELLTIDDPRLDELVDGLAGIDAIGKPRGAPEMVETALGALAAMRAPASADSRGVQVLDAMAARGLPFQALTILGLNERVFPRFILEEPFLRDSVRAQITARLGPRIPLKMRGYDEERLLFTLLASSARDELVLSSQRSDEKGRAQVPSGFLREAPPGTNVPRPPRERLGFVDRSTLTRKEAVLREALELRDGGRLAAAAGQFGWNVGLLDRQGEFLHRIDTARKLGPFDGLIGIKGRGAAVSPTALESFAVCPFQYFAQRVLRFEELKEPELERSLNPMEDGNLLHKVLDVFYRSLDGKIPASLAEGALDTALNTVFRDFEKSRTVRHPLMWEVEQAGIRRVVRAVINDDLATLEGFVPSHFEQAVDEELAVGRVKVRVRGYIDRLDVRPDGAFRVIDYKRANSGRYATAMENGVLKGKYYQPPLYFLLAEKFLGKSGKKPLRTESKSGYLFLRDLADGEKKSKTWLTGSFWENEAEYAGVLGKTLDEIDRGEFPVHVDKHCSTCDFQVMCRRRHLPTRIRAERGGEPDEA